MGGAGLLRRLHDATVGIDLPDSGWREWAAAPEGGEVICHNDVDHYDTEVQAGTPGGVHLDSEAPSS